MITVRVQGGLGNQMFIYAAGRAWALHNNTDLALDISNAGYGQHDTYGRSYKLCHYKINASLADAGKIRRFKPSTRVFYWMRKTNALLPFRFRHMILEPRRFDPRLPCCALNKSAYLAGYWQRDNYFLKYADIIRKELQLRHPPRAEIQELAILMHGDSSVFIHIRRKDYGYKLMPDYYLKAISLITSAVANPRFFVFGDDLPWARRHLYLPPDSYYMEYSDNRTDIEDLWLMTQCRHAITANSSFSWWGAWLRSRHKDAIVSSPSRWGYSSAGAKGWTLLANDLEKDKRFV
jgi:hypothetical protein